MEVQQSGTDKTCTTCRDLRRNLRYPFNSKIYFRITWDFVRRKTNFYFGTIPPARGLATSLYTREALLRFAQTRRGALRAPASQRRATVLLPPFCEESNFALEQSLRLAGSPPPLTRTPKTRLRSFRGTPYTREATVGRDLDSAPNACIRGTRASREVMPSA